MFSLSPPSTKTLNLPWGSCFPYILLKRKGPLSQALWPSDWKVGISVSLALQSCCQATVPPSHVKFSLALRLTSHSYVIPPYHMSTFWSVSAFTKDFGTRLTDLPPNFANCQPGWLQCPGTDPSDPLAPLTLTFKPSVLSWPLLCHAGLLTALPFGVSSRKFKL